MMINPAKVFSELGSKTTYTPLFVKDCISSLGLTAGSCVTGKEEGLDRLIDEFGTEAIWLGGLPAYKKLFDKTIVKALKYDDKFDVRNLKNPEIFEATKQYAPNEEVKKALRKIEKNKGSIKKIAMTKFVVSTLAAIGTFIGLTIFKQKFTEKKLRKNLIKEYENEQAKKSIAEKFEKKQAVQNTDETNDNTNNTSFKSLGAYTEKVIYNSVNNLKLVDIGITGTRVVSSRSWQEAIGYAIKEAAALYFLYRAGGKIQEMLEKNSIKKHNKDIYLDSRVLENNYIKQIFADKSIEKSLKEFNEIKPNKKKGDKLSKDALELYHFIHNNPDNAIIKMAKKSDVIKLYENSVKIDTRRYIDLEDVEGIKNSVENLYKQYKEAVKKGETPEQFFNSVKKLKRKSIIANIGIASLALGVLTPAVMLFKRLVIDKDSEFETKKDVREQLIKEGLIT